MNTTQTVQGDFWKRIEEEKRRDQLIRRVSITAWVIAGIFLLAYTVIIGQQFIRNFGLYQNGMFTAGMTLATLMPLVTVLGGVSLLIATLSTVAIFLRVRTTTLSEIQMRLAALEELIVSKSD